jgi:hypothetical protein
MTVAVLAGERLKKDPQIAAATMPSEVSITALNRGITDLTIQTLESTIEI